MSFRRAVHQTDPNQREIVEALEAAGACVKTWGDDGAPDLVVGFRRRVFLLEVKMPPGNKGGTSRKNQRLNERQAKWHAEWRGQVAVVRTRKEALLAIGAITLREASR